jgi:hypothetical protein
MTSPVQLQILDVIGERLALSPNIAKVERARVIPFRDFDLPAVNYWADGDRLIERGGGWEERELSILIDARTKTRDRPFVDVAFELGADLWVALWRDTAAPAVADTPSPALGGIVTTLRLDGLTPMIGEGQAPFCGVVLAVTAAYKLRPSDPFVLEP